MTVRFGAEKDIATLRLTGDQAKAEMERFRHETEQVEKMAEVNTILARLQGYIETCKKVGNSIKNRQVAVKQGCCGTRFGKYFKGSILVAKNISYFVGLGGGAADILTNAGGEAGKSYLVWIGVGGFVLGCLGECLYGVSDCIYDCNMHNESKVANIDPDVYVKQLETSTKVLEQMARIEDISKAILQTQSTEQSSEKEGVKKERADIVEVMLSAYENLPSEARGLLPNSGTITSRYLQFLPNEHSMRQKSNAILNLLEKEKKQSEMPGTENASANEEKRPRSNSSKSRKSVQQSSFFEDTDVVHEGEEPSISEIEDRFPELKKRLSREQRKSLLQLEEALVVKTSSHDVIQDLVTNAAEAVKVPNSPRGRMEPPKPNIRVTKAEGTVKVKNLQEIVLNDGQEMLLEERASGDYAIPAGDPRLLMSPIYWGLLEQALGVSKLTHLDRNGKRYFPDGRIEMIADYQSVHFERIKPEELV